MRFKLKFEYVELDNLLKAMELVANGIEAKERILAGGVRVNGQVEMRIRRKLRAGDLVEFGEHRIEIVG